MLLVTSLGVVAWSTASGASGSITGECQLTYGGTSSDFNVDLDCTDLSSQSDGFYESGVPTTLPGHGSTSYIVTMYVECVYTYHCPIGSGSGVYSFDQSADYQTTGGGSEDITNTLVGSSCSPSSYTYCSVGATPATSGAAVSGDIPTFEGFPQVDGGIVSYDDSGTGGTPAPCSDPTAALSPIYSSRATGTNSYTFTEPFGGGTTPVEVVGDPEDDPVTQTIHGQTFGADAAVGTISADSVTVTVTPLHGSDPNSTEMWCWDGTTWTDWGNVYSGGSGTPASGPACVLDSWTEPAYSTAGGTFEYSFEVGATNDDFAVVLSPNDPDTTGSLTIDSGALSTSYPDDSVFWEHGLGMSDIALTFPIAAGYSTEGVSAYCYDYSTSTWTTWDLAGTPASGPASGPGGTTGSGSSGASFSLSQCYDSVGASFSWNILSDVYQVVKGGVQLTSCLLQWLFIPSQAAWDNVSDQFGVSSNAPTVGADSASQWLGAVAYMLTVGPQDGAVAIQDCAASGCSAPLVDSGITVDAGGHGYTVSAPAAMTAVASADGSWASILVDMLACFLLVLFFIEVIRWIRKVIGSTE